MTQFQDKTTCHPCFNKTANHWFSSLHLPVALKCNINCHYCTRQSDCPNENRPGRSSRVLTPSPDCGA